VRIISSWVRMISSWVRMISSGVLHSGTRGSSILSVCGLEDDLILSEDDLVSNLVSGKDDLVLGAPLDHPAYSSRVVPCVPNQPIHSPERPTGHLLYHSPSRTKAQL